MADKQTFNQRASDALQELLVNQIPALDGKVFVRYNLRRRTYFYTAHHRGDLVFVNWHTPLADPHTWKLIPRVARAAASMVLQSSHATAVYGPRQERDQDG